MLRQHKGGLDRYTQHTWSAGPSRCKRHCESDNRHKGWLRGCCMKESLWQHADDYRAHKMLNVFKAWLTTKGFLTPSLIYRLKGLAPKKGGNGVMTILWKVWDLCAGRVAPSIRQQGRCWVDTLVVELTLEVLSWPFEGWLPFYIVGSFPLWKQSCSMQSLLSILLATG